MSYDRLDSQRTAAESERRDRDRRVLGAQDTLTPTQRRWLYVGLSVAALLITGVLIGLATLDPGPVSEARPADRIEVQDDDVTLHWSGLECEAANEDRTEVVESAEEVRVTLYVDAPPDGCASHEVEHATSLQLSRPLGDREIIDAACLLPAYLDEPRCVSRNARLE